MAPHSYVWPLAAPRNDYIDEDLPDENEPDASVRAPASLIPSHTSRTQSSSPSLLLIRVTPFLRLGNLWQAGTFAT
jgi:hypothetical protein